ncbi:MAG: aminotransferase class V-fold PLP-dependent enzyme, partial [Deltaproteobacteria bacterium]
MRLPIYLDHHATTPVDPRVLEAMLPFFRESFGNAASRHHIFGWTAEEAVEAARGEVARLIGAGRKEIVFTSGATESINTAIKGVAAGYEEKGRHIVTQVTEHKATLDSCKRLESQGWRVTYLPVDRFGTVDPEAVERALTPQTVLVTIMHANNEIGTIEPIEEIGAITRAHGVLFHVD